MEDKIITENELGDWRRTHYSFQISDSVINEVITVIGWISSKRDHGNVLFVQLRDRFGDIQILVKKKELSESIFESLKKSKRAFFNCHQGQSC